MEELTWKLKSRITWLKEGDMNMKFFHKTENAWRNANTIWHIKNENGDIVHIEEDIRNEAFNHFFRF